LQEILLKVLNNYLTYKTKNHRIPTGSSFAEYVRQEAANSVKAAANITDQYIVRGGIGQGNWAEVPWICILDKQITKTPQKGYYIVYLFDAEMQGVYLSLNQGWTEYRKKYKHLKRSQHEIRNIADHYRKLIRSSLEDFSLGKINLHAKGEYGKGYELGHICGKYYSVNELPPSTVLVDDLRNLMGVYRELKGYLSGRPITDIMVSGSDLIEKEIVEEKEKQAEEEADQLSDEELRKRALQAVTKPSISVKTKHYPRDPYVVAHVKREAKGRCQLCGDKAPFTARNGEPFLECHHIIERSQGGPDAASNAVALCPNCHRRMHNLKSKEDIAILKSVVKDRND
jgi:5-methylcytosine-specific restriction protein A